MKPAGVPGAPSNVTFPKKKKNPARARRSRIRLEQFKERNDDEKKSNLAAEDITSQLVIQLDTKEDRQDRSEWTHLSSPIPQVVGIDKYNSDTAEHTFVSDYHLTKQTANTKETITSTFCSRSWAVLSH